MSTRQEHPPENATERRRAGVKPSPSPSNVSIRPVGLEIQPLCRGNLRNADRLKILRRRVHFDVALRLCFCSTVARCPLSAVASAGK